ncbi:1,3-beta-glucan synthase/callose synthase catalytic subunit [Handroanthus impetiginosus]|uniref:1,3-beta-glucan synthase n=1 Tax=Handroanthus impetiginosus TaxID=429701 RepID=A0A2G9HGK2_9LAMI|nr:1,3-beta-glucan synthase/callose synthase catalytic subunit [Handroanthus impetiginosus]
MSEIIVAEPTNDEQNRASTSSRRPYTTTDKRPFTRSLTSGREHVPERFDSEKLPVTLVSDIQKFLRVANQIEDDEPRVAYLCRFHAFEVAHDKDRNSTGRGVRQFKTSLLQRLEQDEEVTIKKRRGKSDLRELRRVYQQYRNYVDKHAGEYTWETREKLSRASAIASVLYTVLNAVASAAGLQALADPDQSKSEFYVPYNILPLDQVGVHQPIMQLPEIKAAIALVRNVRGLPFLEDCKKQVPHMDLLDWLQFCFGFQEGNVANQREHLILLIANSHTRQTRKQAPKAGDGAVDVLMKKFFKNYTEWCKFLGRNSNIRLPYLKQEAQQYKLLYIALYLLIWGEAANIRFMPECLCFIFHNMASELHGMLNSAVSLTTGERVMPVYGGEPEAFLNHVVSPIYNVIREEAMKNRNGTADHSTWRNYDDLNEFFWSPECFEIGWPMRRDHDFFCIHPSNDGKMKKSRTSVKRRKEERRDNNEDEEMGATVEEVCKPKWLGKTNFVEIRSFWQIFRSFDRMWSFLILALQAMIIMASYDLESPLQVFDAKILEDVMSIFITSAVLKLIQAILDVAFTWKARCTMDSSHRLKALLKIIWAMIWTIVLPIYYSSSRRKYTCYSTQEGSWLEEWCYSSYMVAAAVYLTSNAVNMVLFLVPAAGRYIETSNTRVCTVLSWWTQPRLYIGRGMQEGQVSLLKYTMFWVLLLLSKLSFSYTFEIKPLIAPTRQIMRIGVKNYDWHELFPKVKSNAGAIAAIWSPIILVYFMDAQIWYSVYCSVFGGVYGILHHLGEIRTQRMLKSKFETLYSAFNDCLIPPQTKENEGIKMWLCTPAFLKALENKKGGVLKFALVWNQIISSFREEDLISNREMDLMKIPVSSELVTGEVHWPVFLLANKLSTALSIARDFVGKYDNLLKKIKKDNYMYLVVTECYDSLKFILDFLVVGEMERRIICDIFEEIEESIGQSSLLNDLNMTELPALHAKCTELVELLVEGNEDHHYKVVKALQDMFELVTNDLFINGSRTLDLLHAHQQLGEDPTEFFSYLEPELFASKDSIHFPLPDCDNLLEKVKRFHLLLTVEDKAMYIPSNLEARRRISFFATSLFMNVPKAPKVHDMLSFSVLTPHYMEEVKFSKKELHSNKEGVSISFYMQKIFPDEWENFLERLGSEKPDSSTDDINEEDLRDWTSFRGQTLSRTVRGMMYYRKALKLQAFLDMAGDDDILQHYDTIDRPNDTLSAQLDALVDMKFTHVVSCQMYGAQRTSGDPQAQDILDLMIRYPSLRVAYVEEKEEIVDNKTEKVYSSILVKAVNGFDQAIYRIKLPGSPNIGEGKPENQNHAIIFTRGEALQAIDMNQDNYLEEALKMRNLLQEFQRVQRGSHPTILGMREHIFTGSVSSLGWFMSYQETSFVTIGQRLLANPLRVRFHYGHPDLFDRIFHLTRGGISKASKTINLSEDVFAGFNTTLRRGYITYHEYMQVGKGRDVGLNQISKFEAKVANGNSEQTLSRDIHRLGRRFDFFRMLSFYFTTVGFYFNSLISVIGVYVFLYGQLYLVLSGLQRALLLEARIKNIKSLETALASQSFIQLGLLTGLPMVIEIGLERGFLNALKDFILMQLQLAAVFFTFSYGTKSHYYGRTILHGGAKYRPTGRKVVIFHSSFTENYRLYSRSHFVKGFELLLLLVVYDLFRHSYQSSMAYVLITYAIWFTSMTWLFAPFLFNPSGFNWGKIVDDWKDWNKWIKQQGGIGIQQDKSWQSWWIEEQAHLLHCGITSRLIELLLSLRFFLYQYGLVYHLDISGQNKNFIVYVLSWIVIVIIFLLLKIVNVGRHYLSANHQLAFRLFKAFLFLSIWATIITLSLICDLSVRDLIVCCLAFLPTGWGLILVAQTLRPMIERTGLWHFTRVFARAYDYGMGVVLFAPIAVLAWLPIISAFQTRFLFNEAFSRRLHIQPLLAGKKKHRS